MNTCVSVFCVCVCVCVCVYCCLCVDKFLLLLHTSVVRTSLLYEDIVCWSSQLQRAAWALRLVLELQLGKGNGKVRVSC